MVFGIFTMYSFRGVSRKEWREGGAGEERKPTVIPLNQEKVGEIVWKGPPVGKDM